MVPQRNEQEKIQNKTSGSRCETVQNHTTALYNICSSVVREITHPVKRKSTFSGSSAHRYIHDVMWQVTRLGSDKHGEAVTPCSKQYGL